MTGLEIDLLKDTVYALKGIQEQLKRIADRMEKPPMVGDAEYVAAQTRAIYGPSQHKSL